MIDPNDVPDVESNETLARFVLFGSHVRRDQTLRADAFVPPPNLQLSVTRHRSATEQELLDVGNAVAEVRQRILYGRGDVLALACEQLNLKTVAAPIEGNPNHADICGWPDEKPAQKIIAQDLAASSTFVAATQL
jgi:hypothetical protein